MRLSSFLLCLVLIVLGSFVYSTANRYQKTERKLARLERSLDREYEKIRVLRADWAVLTSPQRLEKLARDYLALNAMDGRQLVALSEIPLRHAMDALVENDDVDGQIATGNRAAGVAPVNGYRRAASPVVNALPVSAGGTP